MRACSRQTIGSKWKVSTYTKTRTMANPFHTFGGTFFCCCFVFVLFASHLTDYYIWYLFRVSINFDVAYSVICNRRNFVMFSNGNEINFYVFITEAIWLDDLSNALSQFDYFTICNNFHSIYTMTKEWNQSIAIPLSLKHFWLHRTMIVLFEVNVLLERNMCVIIYFPMKRCLLCSYILIVLS